MGAVNSERQSWRDTLNKISENIDTIISFVTPKTVMLGSPTKYTELGAAISGEINAKDIANTLANGAVSQVEGKHPYEVEKFCFKYVEESKLTAEQKDVVYTAAYEHGLDAEDVYDVIAIELRDHLLTLLREDGQ